MKFIPIWLLGILLFMASCGGNVQLDNARSDSATINIDGTAHELAAGERSWISLEPGTHKVLVSDAQGESVVDTTIRLKEAGVIHTGGSNYWVWRRLYGLQKERETLLNEDWMETDSSKLYGDFKAFPPNMIFIEKYWDYELDDEMPDGIKLYSTSDFVVKAKIFRENELIQTYRELSKAAE